MHLLGMITVFVKSL